MGFNFYFEKMAHNIGKKAEELKEVYDAKAKPTVDSIVENAKEAISNIKSDLERKREVEFFDLLCSSIFNSHDDAKSKTTTRKTVKVVVKYHKNTNSVSVSNDVTDFEAIFPYEATDLLSGALKSEIVEDFLGSSSAAVDDDDIVRENLLNKLKLFSSRSEKLPVKITLTNTDSAPHTFVLLFR